MKSANAIHLAARDSWARPEGEAQQGAKDRDRDRVSHPQPDGRARQAEVLRRGVMNEHQTIDANPHEGPQGP